MGGDLLRSTLCQSAVGVWAHGGHYRPQACLSAWVGVECSQLTPVWLGTDVRMVSAVSGLPGHRLCACFELCSGTGHTGLCRSRAQQSPGNIYYALRHCLNPGAACGWPVGGALGLVSGVLFSRSDSSARGAVDGAVGATTRCRIAESAF